MLALPRAKILHSFKRLCAVLYSCVLAKKSLALCSSALAVLKSARGTCRFRLLTKGAGAAAKRCGCAGRRSAVRCFCFEERSETDCLPATSQGTFTQFEFTRAANVLLTWIFLCACDKWLITRKNWFWQGRSWNTLCLFPHGHAQMPPRWKKSRLLSGFFQGKSKTRPWRWPYSTENKQFVVVAWS